MKQILNIAFWVLLLVGLLVLLGFVDSSQDSQKLKQVDVTIDHSDGNHFVVEEEIREIFLNQGYTLDDEISAIRLNSLEKTLTEQSSVEKADVYVTVSGELNIDILQRVPLVRVYSSNGESYYIDKNGGLMPLSEKYTAKVPVANGNISATYAKYNTFNFLTDEITKADSSADFRLLKEIFKMAHYISNDSFWDAQISQIYINKNKEMELIPRVGSHVILFGDSVDLEKKFKKLKIFYQKGLNKTGWNSYSEINLKYKNQVVCKKL